MPSVVGQITKGAVFAALVGLADVGNSKWDATAAPGVGDDSADGYIVGSIWADVTNKAVYVCTNNAVGAAVWVQILAASGSGTAGQMGMPGFDGEAGEDAFPIPGPPGAAGAAGSAGAAGAAGALGPPGIDGNDGLDGIPIPGPAGAAGAAGSAGAAGAMGPPGMDGEAGEDGWPIPGPKGDTGAAGSAGAAGAAGAAGMIGPPGLDGADGEEGFPSPFTHVHAGKVTHCMAFLLTGPLTVSAIIPYGLCVGESGEHGTFAGIRGKAVCDTVGVGTNTIVIEADDDPTFPSATTLFTLPLDAAQEVDDATLDNAWAAGDIWIRARCTAIGSTAPINTRVQFYYTEAVWG